MRVRVMKRLDQLNKKHAEVKKIIYVQVLLLWRSNSRSNSSSNIFASSISTCAEMLASDLVVSWQV